MTDLKSIIIDIQAKKNTNKWDEIVKVAYERGELIKLLSADDEYVYDANGQLWLANDPSLAPEDRNPMAIGPLISGVYNQYRKDRCEVFKANFVSAVKQMASGNPKQIYLSAQIYHILAMGETNKISPFYSRANKDHALEELRIILEQSVASQKSELSVVFIYNCQNCKKGVYDYCRRISRDTTQIGLKGFAGDKA